MAEHDLDAIKGKLREYILAECLPGESPDNLKDDTALRTSGILDSLTTIKLIEYLETAYDIEFEAHETGVENFDKIEDIASLVAGKCA